MTGLALWLWLSLPASAQWPTSLQSIPAEDPPLSEESGPAPLEGAALDCTAGIRSAPGKFCDSIDECKAFCGCACRYDPKKGRLSACPGLPRHDIPGGVMPDSPALRKLPRFDFISVSSPDKVRATQRVVDALTRLDAELAVSKTREEHGYRIRVNSCHRPHLEDTWRECGIVLRSWHKLETGTYESDKDKAEAEAFRDPNKAGLSWPGSTPHSAGFACDIVLVDRKGRDCFACKAGTGDKSEPSCTIPVREASKLLDQELDKTGAVRLSYEAWHYEWRDDPPPNRCRAGECSRWPLTCKSG